MEHNAMAVCQMNWAKSIRAAAQSGIRTNPILFSLVRRRQKEI